MKLDKPPKPDRDAYYAQATSWSQDVNGALRASRRLAWIVAAGAGAIAVLEAIALVSLAPLKTVVPYTITVDRQTGYIETAQGLRPGLQRGEFGVRQSTRPVAVLLQVGVGELGGVAFGVAKASH